MTRVIVVGTGGAGLGAAIEAARAGAHVDLVTKTRYDRQQYRWASAGGCTWKTHAFNAAVSPGDSVAAHIADTITGGSQANNPQLVDLLCHGSPDLVRWLEEAGLEFEKKNGESEFATRPFSGCGTPRGLFIEDRLGFHIQRALNDELDKLVSDGKVEVLSGVRATRLMVDADGAVNGLAAVVVDSLEILRLPGDAVILADGGGTSMYAPTAASLDKTCDGITLGLKAGAEVIDMEFVQFHPTGLVSDVLTFDGSLVEEAVRFDDATLLNRDRERFMFGHDPRGEQATRDVVSRGIYREIIDGRGNDDGSVHLDISACRHLILRRYPALAERLTQAGCPLADTTVLRIRPTAHFLMGGLRIDLNAQTSITGLYAAGETAGGVHGANRLGGNGLSEALVFGRIAGRHAAESARRPSGHANDGVEIVGSYRFAGGPGRTSADSILQDLRNGMYWNAGPIRTEHGLTRMLALISELEDQAQQVSIASGSRAAGDVQTYLDVENLLVASRTIVEGALLRRESRGAHYRADFQKTMESYEGTVASWKEDRLSWSTYSHS